MRRAGGRRRPRHHRRRRPVLLVGLEAREERACAALRQWASELGCPVLTSYKAKGVMPDGDPLAVGQVTGAVAEGACIGQADLIVFYGLDPVEMIPVPWAYQAPVLDLARVARERRYVDPAVEVVAPLAEVVEGLRGINRRSAWTAERIRDPRNGMRARLASPESAGIAPRALVEAARKAAPAGTRATVDAGAHMVSAMAFWDADEAHGVLKSNGLSTMGYALPAAIASALAEPDRPVVAFTGDGGLAMCLAELATAARLGLDITAVVFNDAALSLIDLKQRGRGLASSGVRYPRRDLASVARALGWRAWAVAGGPALEPALAEAMAASGPALVDVAVDPGGYPEQFAALRG
ncbi:MAG: thiamine pyrophosphate-dependent enzyme [Alphaproteobacteria bacterium]